MQGRTSHASPRQDELTAPLRDKRHADVHPAAAPRLVSPRMEGGSRSLVQYGEGYAELGKSGAKCVRRQQKCGVFSGFILHGVMRADEARAQSGRPLAHLLFPVLWEGPLRAPSAAARGSVSPPRRAARGRGCGGSPPTGAAEPAPGAERAPTSRTELRRRHRYDSCTSTWHLRALLFRIGWRSAGQRVGLSATVGNPGPAWLEDPDGAWWSSPISIPPSRWAWTTSDRYPLRRR
jgi:hypothetical protein